MKEVQSIKEVQSKKKNLEHERNSDQSRKEKKMLMQTKVLSDEEIRTIHKNSIRILEETGVKFPSEKALDLLEDAGAEIDREKEIAYINEDMVKKALQTAPKEFTLGAPDPKYDLSLPAAFPTHNIDGCGMYVLDHGSRKKRPGTTKDIENSFRIFQTMDQGSIGWAPIVAADLPPKAAGVMETGLFYINSSKHYQDEETSIKGVGYHMEMAKAILGSWEEVRKRKIYSATYCTVAPLCHDHIMLEATMELTKYEAPILAYPMPACGSTGPASLFTNVAMANAEALSCFVIFQLCNPGTPIIYGAALGSINMKSGIFLEGAPETALQLTAMTQMGRYYGFPTEVAGCLSDSKEPGMQAILEKYMNMEPLIGAGADVVQGIGLLESSMTLSLEQMIIDDELFRYAVRMRKGIDTSEEKDLLEDIKAVGPEGHFLKQKSTRKLFRSDEFYRPKDLIDRNSHDEWISLGSPDMYSAANKRVCDILAEEPLRPLDRDTEKTIREIMEEAKAKLSS